MRKNIEKFFCYFSIAIVIKHFLTWKHFVNQNEKISTIHSQWSSFLYFHLHSTQRLTRCRVDFQKTPTKNCRINLSVLGECYFYFEILTLNEVRTRTRLIQLQSINNFSTLLFTVPPTKLEIFDEQGFVASNNIIGPYREGSSVNITCMSTGGK